MRIAAVVPTFNEFDVLTRCLDSLQSQPEGVDLDVIVVNAGEPLPPELRDRVREIRVHSNCFWTACIGAGLAVVRQEKAWDYVMLANADTIFLPGSVQRLADEAAKGERIVCCSPAYEQYGPDAPKLLYSRDRLVPVLLHNFLERAWTTPDQAPDEVWETDIAGGQGTLFSASYLDEFDVDPKRFPHYKGDVDLWLSMKRKGIRLMMVGKAGIVNVRPFGVNTGKTRWQKFSRAWWLVTSPNARDGVPVTWYLRMKHLPFPLGVLSFLAFIPLIYAWRLVKFFRYN